MKITAKINNNENTNQLDDNGDTYRKVLTRKTAVHLLQISCQR